MPSLPRANALLSRRRRLMILKRKIAQALQMERADDDAPLVVEGAPAGLLAQVLSIFRTQGIELAGFVQTRDKEIPIGT